MFDLALPGDVFSAANAVPGFGSSDCSRCRSLEINDQRLGD
jgi:hypothetical protein